MAATAGNGRFAGAVHDPMQQFAELAGDVRDPYAMLAVLREISPVNRVSLEVQRGQPRDEKPSPSAELDTAVSYECVARVLTDPVRFSSGAWAMSLGQVLGKTIMQMDSPEHLRHRALVAKVFRARALEQWGDTLIAVTINELIDAFAADGHADLVRQLTIPFPVQVIARILGLPRADYPHFLQLSAELIGVAQNWDRGLAASRELRAYFAEIIAARRRNPRGDLVSQLVLAEVDGQRLRDDEIYPFLMLMLPAGAETTYRSLGNLLFGLLTYPAQLAAVRADRSLLPQAIEEGLRWEAPVLSIPRIAVGDVELGGVSIPDGAVVTLSLGAANRDPRCYPDPDTFDIFRSAKQHLSFGHGPHLCLGMHLARLETRLLLNAVFDRLQNLRIDPAAHDPHIHGRWMRSPPDLPVLFDPEHP